MTPQKNLEKFVNNFVITTDDKVSASIKKLMDKQKPLYITNIEMSQSPNRLSQTSPKIPEINHNANLYTP